MQEVTVIFATGKVKEGTNNNGIVSPIEVTVIFTTPKLRLGTNESSV